jgi:low temperature requirement protein LtrA
MSAGRIGLVMTACEIGLVTWGNPNLGVVFTESASTATFRGVRWPEPQWLSLFYDLAFAAGIIAIANSYGVDHSAAGALWFATTYGIIASAWLMTGGATGWFTDRPRQVTTPIVILIAIQMAAVLMLSVASGDTIASSTGVFDILLLVLLATCLGLGWLARSGAHAMPSLSQWLIGLAMVLIGMAWLFTEVTAILWELSLAALVVASALVVMDSRVRISRMAHRLGELTIIITGETLVKMVLTVGDDALWEVGLTALLAALLLLVATFWAYFTGPVGVTELAGRRRLVWVFGHWSLHVALLGVAVGLSKLLIDSQTLAEPGAVLALLTGPGVLIVASLALLDWVTAVPQWRILSVAAVLVCAVATASAVGELTPMVSMYAVAIIPLVALAVGNRQSAGRGP